MAYPMIEKYCSVATARDICAVSATKWARMTITIPPVMMGGVKIQRLNSLLDAMYIYNGLYLDQLMGASKMHATTAQSAKSQAINAKRPAPNANAHHGLSAKRLAPSA